MTFFTRLEEIKDLNFFRLMIGTIFDFKTDEEVSEFLAKSEPPLLLKYVF